MSSETSDESRVSLEMPPGPACLEAKVQRRAWFAGESQGRSGGLSGGGEARGLDDRCPAEVVERPLVSDCSSARCGRSLLPGQGWHLAATDRPDASRAWGAPLGFRDRELIRGAMAPVTVREGRFLCTPRQGPPSSKWSPSRCQRADASHLGFEPELHTCNPRGEAPQRAGAKVTPGPEAHPHVGNRTGVAPGQAEVKTGEAPGGPAQSGAEAAASPSSRSFRAADAHGADAGGTGKAGECDTPATRPPLTRRPRPAPCKGLAGLVPLARPRRSRSRGSRQPAVRRPRDAPSPRPGAQLSGLGRAVPRPLPSAAEGHGTKPRTLSTKEPVAWASLPVPGRVRLPGQPGTQGGRRQTRTLLSCTRCRLPAASDRPRAAGACRRCERRDMVLQTARRTTREPASRAACISGRGAPDPTTSVSGASQSGPGRPATAPRKAPCGEEQARCFPPGLLPPRPRGRARLPRTPQPASRC